MSSEKTPFSNPPANLAATGAGRAAPGAGLPYIPASQATALLRSGLAIAVELMQSALPTVIRDVLEAVASRWDMDVGAPLVQRMLTLKAHEFQTEYIEHLCQRQDAALQALQRKTQDQPKREVDFESMTLIEADALQSMTLVERSASRVFAQVEERLRDLNFVVGYLTGRASLRAADSPFAPDVFISALVLTGQQQQLHEDAFDYMLQVFEKPLSEEMSRIHAELIAHYRSHGLDPVAIRRSVAPRANASASGFPNTNLGPSTLAGPPSIAGGTGWSHTTPAHGAMSQPGRPAPAPSAPLDPVARPGQMSAALGAPAADPNFVLNDLIRRLQVNAHDLHVPAMPAPEPAGPELLGAINELQQLGLEGFHGAAFAGTGAGSINAWRGHLVEKSARTVDKLTIELVGMLFEHILQDKQVPAEIKAILSRMQFPVLKAALLDADFFASGTHPARRLIDRVAATSVGWEPYGDENERYRQYVEDVVRQVLEKFDKDLGIFEKLLAQFDAFVAEVPQRESDPVARAKKVLEAAEKREILVINTTIQVRRAFEKVELEPYMRDFLLGPWVQVLVAAGMRDDETPGFSKRFREVIHDVVWSIQPKGFGEDRKRLVAMIPEMMRILRDGLALIRMPEREQTTFFNDLMQSHAMAVKPVDQADYIRASLQTSELRASIDNMHITGNAPITTVAGGIRVPSNEVLRLAKEQNAEIEMPDLATDIGGLDRVEEAGYDEQMGRWARGTWFELFDGKQMVKARLRWISPLRTLFLFSLDKTNAAQVMAPPVIKSYLKKGWLKPIEKMPLMQRVVDRVVGEFEKMPARREALAGRYAAPGS